jgi:hypothetical protein
MPRVPLPGGGGAGAPVHLKHLSGAEGNPANAPVAPGVRAPQALGGWHDLNMAVARSLPTSLLRAGQFQRGIEKTLRRRGRVR